MLTTLAAQNWGLFIVRGIAALLFAAFAFLAPGPTLAALIFVFALYAIVDGVLAVVVGLGTPGGPRWLLVAGGILVVGIGIYTGFNPSVTATALVILIGAFVLVRGAAELSAAITMRSVVPDAWLIGLSGIVSMVFGAYLLVVPSDGALALVYLIGFYALFAGVMDIAMGARLRSFVKAVQHATQDDSRRGLVGKRRLTSASFPEREPARLAQIEPERNTSWTSTLGSTTSRSASQRSRPPWRRPLTRPTSSSASASIQAQTDADRALSQAKQEAGAAADRTKDSWEQRRADAQASMAVLKAKAQRRADKVDADFAASDADLAEADASDAIDFADWAVENARLADPRRHRRSHHRRREGRDPRLTTSPIGHSIGRQRRRRHPATGAPAASSCLVEP